MKGEPRGMRRVCRINVMLLGLVLATASAGLTAEKIVVDGSTGVMPLVAALARAYQERYPAATIQIGRGLGGRARIQALAEGTIDIALASHGVVAEEITRQGLAVHEIARVAVVFGVNASVPVRDLTDRQICHVYSGTVTNWKELGGPDLVIAPRTRPDTEVDAEIVRAKIGCLKDLRMAEIVTVMSKSGHMAKELAATVGAIGMTTMTVVEQSQGKVKALSVNGITPGAEEVKKGTYTLTRDSLLVTKAQPSAAVAKFLEFIRSPAMEQVVLANGAVPVR